MTPAEKVKFHILHLHVFAIEIREIHDIILDFQASEFDRQNPGLAMRMSAYLNQLVIIKSASYIREWQENVHLITDAAFVSDMNSKIDRILATYPDIFDYRNEVGAHLYGRFVGPRSSRVKESIFNSPHIAEYKVPNNRTETTHFLQHMNRIFESVRNFNTALIAEIESGIFPPPRTLSPDSSPRAAKI